ncbi:MAG: helix-turn-helix domain-containing protein [Chthoniobacteraceae bacterium]
MKKTRQSEIKNVIGERVREARIKLNPPVSQNDLVGRLARQGIQITQTGISKLESGNRAVLDYEVVALAKVLKVSVEWLLEGR